MEELFEFDGQEYTLTEVQEAAKAKSLNIDDYINQYNISRKPGKTTPPKEDNQGAPAEVNAAPDTDSKLEDTSLEYTSIEPFEEFEQKKSIITEEGEAELRQAGDGKFKPIELEEVVVTGKDKTQEYFKKLNKINQQARLSTLSTITKIPEIGVSTAAGVAATTTDILGGFLILLTNMELRLLITE